MRLIDCFLFQWVITSYDVDLINTAVCNSQLGSVQYKG